MRRGNPAGQRARRTLSILLSLLPMVGLAREPAGRADLVMTDRVLVAIDRGDCAWAVKALNEGLPHKYPNLLMLAGTMFEEGICLKANWPRAVAMYSAALQADAPGAADKLASGFAVALEGQDKAAALWWALAGRVQLPTPCQEPKAVREDAARFAQILAGWPRERLDACVYVAGVLGTVSGDMEFPAEALARGLRGSVSLRFIPSEARIEILADEVEAIEPGGLTDGTRLADRDTRSSRSIIRRHVQKLTERALRRYQAPAGIDPSWRIETQWVFNYVL